MKEYLKVAATTFFAGFGAAVLAGINKKEPKKIPAAPDNVKTEECWWSLKEDTILDMLRRVEAGADANMVYLQLYANSSISTGDDS